MSTPHTYTANALFLHGWALSPAIWTALSARLPWLKITQHDFGFQKKNTRPHPLTAPNKTPDYIIAHSLGGLWALSQKLRPRKGFIFINSFHNFAPFSSEDTLEKLHATLSPLKNSEKHTPVHVHRFLQRANLGPLIPDDPSTWNIPRLQEGLQWLKTLSGTAEYTQLETNGLPILVLMGGRDTICPHRIMNAHWTQHNKAHDTGNCRLITHPTAGHGLPLEDPDWCADQISDWVTHTTVTAAFSRNAHTYDQHTPVQRHIAERLINELASLPAPPNRILEIGCGTGTLTHKLAARFPQAHITATDISPSMLHTAQDKWHPHPPNRITWHCMDGQNPSTLPHTHYDLIISNMCVQWFSDLHTSYTRWIQHLKPGGTLLASRLGPNSFPQWTHTLKTLNLSSGTLQGTISPLLHTTLTHTHHYDSTLSFLRSLKHSGAGTATAQHTPLTPKQLKQACTLCDQTHHGAITWEIHIDKHTHMAL